MSLQNDARPILIDRFADAGVTFTDEVLDAVLLNIPTDDLLTGAANRVRWEWWNELLPVNGVPAEQVREQFDIPDRAFLVYVDNQLVYFQPHDPSQPGMVPLTAESDAVATAFVDTVVQRLALEAFVALAGTQLQMVADQQAVRSGVTPAPADTTPAALRRRRATTASGG